MEPVEAVLTGYLFFVIELAIRRQNQSPAIILVVSPSTNSLALTLSLLSNLGRLGDKLFNQPFIEPSLADGTSHIEKPVKQVFELSDANCKQN